MSEKPAPSLLSLPTEIIQLILSYIPSQHLSQNVEMTCKELRKAMIPVYRVRYGHEPAPSVPVSSSCWKRFAIQHEFYCRHTDHKRDGVVDGFLKSYLESPDHHVSREAEYVIYYLHNNPHIHPRGIEAIVAALNIQHRCRDSNVFLLRYRDSDAMPFQSMALLQARFNLQFSVSWSTCSSELLECCLSAVATSGDMGLFVYFKQLLLEAGKHVQVQRVVNAAIRSDRVEILRELCTEFHTLPLFILMEVAAYSGSANIVQFLLELGPTIDLEYPYELALRHCNLDVLRRLETHSPRTRGSYLRNGQLQIAVILANPLESWANKSKTIEFLVKHASVDINAIGMDGLAVVHIAAVNNYIDALKLFENLRANMTSLGEIGQTPAEIAVCNEYNIPFLARSSLPIELFAVKQDMAKTIIGKQCDAMFKGQRKCPGFDRSLTDAKNKLADIWAKSIGLETLRGLLSMIDTPLFESVEKLRRIIMEVGQRPVMPREEQLRGVNDIKDILKKFLNQQYPDGVLTHLACYLQSKLDQLDIERVRIFVNSEIGRALYLRRCSFAREEQEIWMEFREAASKI
ncbi:hypothetical protein HAV15_010037 [Penicillium sp. str. |nr:hypothetical protein HAV15_010037 [Penicillium sp. str. \